MFNSKRGQYAPQGGPQYNPAQFRPNIPQPGAFGAPPSQPTVSISPKTLMIIGAIAVIIILTFTIILVIRANSPKCPSPLPAGVCDINVRCSKDTNYQVLSDKKEGCDVNLEMKRKGCTGKAGPLVKSFDPVSEECLTDVDPKAKIVPYSSTERLSFGGGKLRVTTQLNQPFNLKKDQVSIEIMAETLTGSNVRITHVELDGNDAQGLLVIAGEQLLTRQIAAIQSPIKLYLQYLDITSAEPSGALKTPKLLIDIAYTSGTTEKTEKLTMTLRNLVFNWLKPTMSYPCPQSCDDRDASTKDSCDAASAPFCKHEAVAGACGNGVCDANENKCTCAADCGQCTSAGKVSESACVDNACRVQLKASTVVEPIKVTTSTSAGRVGLKNTLEYNKPFNADTDKVKVTIFVDTSDTSVTEFTIGQIQILKAGNVEVSSTTLNQGVGLGDSATTTLPITTLLNEESLTPQVKVSYTITAGGKTTKSTFTLPMQQVYVFNPS